MLSQQTLLHLVAIGTFDIDDFDDWLWNSLDAHVASGFKHYRIPATQNGIHQRVDLLLFQRLAARDLHQLCGIARDNGQHFIE